MATYDNINPEIIPASDTDGKSAKITVRVPCDWIRHMDAVIKYKKIDYVNKGDFIRDAIQRHFQWIEMWLKENDVDRYGSIWGKINMILRGHEQDRYLQGFHAVIASLRERVGTFIRRGAEKEALKHILKSLQIINEMPDSYWKNIYKQSVETEYNELLTNEKHRINVFEEED